MPDKTMAAHYGNVDPHRIHRHDCGDEANERGGLVYRDRMGCGGLVT